jgi:hypothetical protein
VILFPPRYLALVERVSGSVDAEARVLDGLTHLEGDSGERFAVRDEQGFFTCPECGIRSAASPFTSN